MRKDMRKEKTTTAKAWGTRVKAFYEDGRAWVYDEVAGGYTSCHSLTATQVARIKRLADRDS